MDIDRPISLSMNAVNELQIRRGGSFTGVFLGDRLRSGTERSAFLRGSLRVHPRSTLWFSRNVSMNLYDLEASRLIVTLSSLRDRNWMLG